MFVVVRYNTLKFVPCLHGSAPFALCPCPVMVRSLFLPSTLVFPTFYCRLVDCFRRLHPDRKSAFTCWNTQTGARENNYGTRIDYIIADKALAERALRECDIMPDFLGSDHCPVRARFVVPLPPRSTPPPAGAPSDGGQESGGGGGSREGEWPEHPPECSCFYQELTAKQEKLAKYFVAGGGQTQAPGGDAEQQGVWVVGGGSVKESGGGGGSDRKREDMLPAAGGGGERGAGPLKWTLSGATSTGGSNGGGGASWMVRGQKAGGVRRTLSSASARSAAARRAGSGGSRQSKLQFGAAASSAVAGGDGGTGGGAETIAKGGPAARASSRVDHARGSASSGAGGGAAAGASPARESRTAIEGANPRSNDFVQGHGGTAPPGQRTAEVGNIISSSNSSGSSRSSEVDADRAAARSGGGGPSGGSGGSAEAWKALFGGQKKSAPPCEHGEPSIQRTVLKPGPNYNRRFYTCARSAGSWPTDRNARCNFFQWRRDGVRGYKDRPSRDEGATAASKRRRV